MSKLKISAEKRTQTGRNAKKLRREGVLPANIYGKGVKSEAIQIPLIEFTKLFEKAGETTLIEVSLGKALKTVLISDIQLNPVTGLPLHADFREVNLKEKVTATVPVVLEGDSPAEDKGLGTVVQQISELEVEALPLDLPEHISADATVLLDVDNMIHIKDLKIDSKIEIKADPELVIALVQPPQKEEEIAPPAASEEQESEEEPSESTEPQTEDSSSPEKTE